MLFDTSSSIEWLKGNNKLLEIVDTVTISTITEYELLWSAIEKSKKARSEVEDYLDGVDIIPVGSRISRIAAQTQASLRSQGSQKSMADLLIVATAKEHKLSVCSFDNDFKTISEEMEVDLIFLN